MFSEIFIRKHNHINIMPKYFVDIEHLITKEEAMKMISYAKKLRDKALISILYLTGARPGEVLDLTTDDIRVSDRELEIKLTTLKQKEGRFHVKKRTLVFHRPLPSNAFIETFIDYFLSLPRGYLFKMSDRNLRYIIERVSRDALGFPLCPYNFRHSRMTEFASEGRGINELKYLKGATDIRSIAPYLHARKVYVNFPEVRIKEET